MLNRKIALFLFLSSIYCQTSLSGYGYGNIENNSDLRSFGSSSELLPSFKNNVSLANPSTWHNLLFTYLNTSLNVQSAEFQSTTQNNFSLSSAKLVVPWKGKMSFGLSFEPYLNRQLTISDSTATSYELDDENSFDVRRERFSSGGPSVIKMSYGYKLNDNESVGVTLGTIFGSSRSSINLIIDEENHLLQSRDYFSGNVVDFYISSKRLSFKTKPLILSANYHFPINGINVENDTYQAFLDLNDNNYHDLDDFPDVGQALLPLNFNFKDEISINSLRLGADYEFKKNHHLQFELLDWKDNGKHISNNSVVPGYIKSRSKISFGFASFVDQFDREKINYKASVFFQDYDVKSLENINEVGLGLGIGFNFGITANQIDFGYQFINRSGIHLIDNEKIQNFTIGISIGDLWFVKRREI